MNEPNLAQILTALAAVIAGIAGPLVSMRVARLQFKATVLSSNRQQWINNLREQIAKILSDMTASGMRKASHEIYIDRDFIEMNELLICKNKIFLMLNSNDKDHSWLIKLIYRSYKSLYEENFNVGEFMKSLDAIKHKAQEIFIQEWARVKRGEESDSY